MIANIRIGNLTTSIVENLEQSIRKIGSIARTGNDFDTSLISDEAYEVIKNPEDRRELDKAVEYLQKNTAEKTKEVKLSGDKTITISLG